MANGFTQASDISIDGVDGTVEVCLYHSDQGWHIARVTTPYPTSGTTPPAHQLQVPAGKTYGLYFRLDDSLPQGTKFVATAPISWTTPSTQPSNVTNQKHTPDWRQFSLEDKNSNTPAAGKSSEYTFQLQVLQNGEVQSVSIVLPPSPDPQLAKKNVVKVDPTIVNKGEETGPGTL